MTFVAVIKCNDRGISKKKEIIQAYGPRRRVHNGEDVAARPYSYPLAGNRESRTNYKRGEWDKAINFQN